MKIKEDKKLLFLLSTIAIMLFVAARVIGIIKNGFNMDIIMDVLMLIVVIRCLMISCIEKNK